MLEWIKDVDVFRSVLLGSCVVLAGCLVGCQGDDAYPTIGDVKQFADIESRQLEAHNENISEQLNRLAQALAPEVAPEIKAIRDGFTAISNQLSGEREGIEGSAPWELILAGIAGGGVLGGIFGKTGKSRSQPEIDALKSKIAELNAKT